MKYEVDSAVSNNSIINDLITEANRIRKDRGQEYNKDGQERNMKRIVDVFNAYHDTELTEAQGWHFMQILKDVRLLNAPAFHRDSAVDGLNYHLLKCEALQQQQELEAIGAGGVSGKLIR